MIAGGAALLNHAYWVLYLFAAFLIFTGIRMFFAGDQPMDVANNRAVKFISSHMRITPELHGQHFFVKTKDAVTGKVVTARSEEHTSELQSLMRISYAVFCLKKKKLQQLISKTVV